MEADKNEKKGSPLNQLAIIADLIEKANLETLSATIIFEQTGEEYDRVYNYFKNKVNGSFLKKPGKTFTIEIGEVSIVFNKNSDETTQSS